MTKIFFACFCMCLFTGKFAKAQLLENFDDGNFTANPVWSGSAADFIVNSSLQLQSNNIVANSTYFLTTPNTLATAVQWEMYIQLTFNPSSANYVDVYLAASASDVTSLTTTGYFVRLGNTEDEISLYRKDAGGITVKIIDGADGILNNSVNTLKLKIIRDENNQWIISRDVSGTGNSYINEGAVTDATYTTTSFFGFLIKQSTAGFFQKHFFDDIKITSYIPDVVPPDIQSATATSLSTLDVVFNEPVEKSSSELATNYSVDNSLGNPVSAVLDAANPALVHLFFAGSFTNAVGYTLTINGVKDIAGNILDNGLANFSFHTSQQYDVVIDEIMADPSPQTGLPNNEWIELRNTAAFPINLRGWFLADASGPTGVMPAFILQPDSVVIVCTGSAVALLAQFGNTISVTGFPSLDNDGDLISLYDATGKTIHAVSYTSAWYQNELKKEGGWTLEMIDSKNPCSGITNWKASINASGGTPGKINSVDGINNDETAPKLLRAFVADATTITLVFDEPLDSLKASAINKYTFTNGINAISATVASPVFDKVNIVLNNPLTPNTVYSVTATNLADCSGNNIGSKNTAQFGLAQEAGTLDMVINEVLYNPKSGGVDYVELYNRSQKIIDLSHVYIANRSNGVVSSIRQVTTENILLFPANFMVLTSDPFRVKVQYITTNPEAFIAVSSMPSFADDAGCVIILNNQGNIVDEVDYTDKWQFPLISNTEGVALERIDYNGPSVQSNFHSAATSVGYGTPGYKNSQYRIDEKVQGTITVTPETFSPDNDGTDDFATINYNFPAPGYVANITIFDAAGRPVRYLQRNSLSGITGYYRWDGLDDKNRKLPQGIYIIYTEIFNTEGKKKQFKNVVVLARKY